jgi:hypothetical protein
MDHSAGLDVSVKETSICIVDDTGFSVWKSTKLHFVIILTNRLRTSP